jgi:hypothetical protein
LLADKDPYNSLKSTWKPEQTPESKPEIASQGVAVSSPPSQGLEPHQQSGEQAGVRGQTGNQTAQSQVEIRKAIPVQPQERGPVEIRRAIPVKPLDHEDQDDTLLKAMTPPPVDE